MPEDTELVNEIPSRKDVLEEYADVVQQKPGMNTVTSRALLEDAIAKMYSRAADVAGLDQVAMGANGNALTKAIMGSISASDPTNIGNSLTLFNTDGLEGRDKNIADAAALGLHGTAAAAAAQPYARAIKWALPAIGGVSGLMGDAGLLRGTLRGAGATLGASAGGLLGQVASDYLGDTDAVKNLDPKLQGAITASGILGGNLLGGLAGYGLTKKITKTDEEEKKERRREKYASINKAYEALLAAK